MIPLEGGRDHAWAQTLKESLPPSSLRLGRTPWLIMLHHDFAALVTTRALKEDEERLPKQRNHGTLRQFRQAAHHIHLRGKCIENLTTKHSPLQEIALAADAYRLPAIWPAESLKCIEPYRPPNTACPALGEKWLVLGAPNTCIIRETAPLIDVTIGKVMPSYRTLAAPGHRQVKRWPPRRSCSTFDMVTANRRNRRSRRKLERTASGRLTVNVCFSREIAAVQYTWACQGQ